MTTDQALKITMRERAIAKIKSQIEIIAIEHGLSVVELAKYYRAIHSYTGIR